MLTRAILPRRKKPDPLSGMHRMEKTGSRISAEQYRRMHPAYKDESEFEAWVIRVLHVNGWLVSSMKDSRKQRLDADAGVPDIVAVNRDKCRILFTELKMPGKKPTPKQKLWLDALDFTAQGWTFSPATEGVFVECWYPEDEAKIIEIAGGKVPIA